MRKNIFFICLICCVCGCGWLGSPPAPSQQTEKLTNSGRIIDASLLKKQGNLLIVPFPAGENVAATEELDQSSLMVVKGIFETFQDKGTAFILLDSKSIEKADYLIKGYMTRFSVSKGIKGLLGGRGEITIASEGQLVDRASGQPVLIFSFQRKSRQKSIDHRDLAYRIGQDIAEYIIGQMN